MTVTSHKFKPFLPSLVTALCLASGCVSLTYAKTNVFLSGYAILLAMILDFFDGFIARATQTQSDFGAQLDSLADTVAFGVAPALLWYEHNPIPDIYRFSIMFLMILATICRLARFNASNQQQIKTHFIGLPCPLAAGLLACTIICQYQGLLGKMWSILCFSLPLILGWLQVSNVRCISLKSIDQSLSYKISLCISLISLIAVISFYKTMAFALMILFTLYIAHGLTSTCHACAK